MRKEIILITGTTGQQGGATARNLLAITGLLMGTGVGHAACW